MKPGLLILLLFSAALGCGAEEPNFGRLRIDTVYTLGEEAVKLLPATVVRALTPVDGRPERDMVCEPSDWGIQSDGAQAKGGFYVQLELPQFREWRVFLFASPRSVEELVASRGPADGDFYGVSNVLELDDCGEGLNGSKCFSGSFSGGRIVIDQPVGVCP